MGKQKQQLKFEDYRNCDYAVNITMEAQPRVPCAICWEEPKDPDTSIEVLVGNKWRVVCNECAMRHAEYLTEQLNSDRLSQVREMEALYAVIFEMDRLRQKAEIDQEEEQSLEASA